LAIGDVAKRDCALGDRVGQLVPRIHELVEVQVKRSEVGSHHGPVQLFADQGQVDELVQHPLEDVPDLLALMRLLEGGEICRC
jgi:hypothetical protein